MDSYSECSIELLKDVHLMSLYTGHQTKMPIMSVNTLLCSSGMLLQSLLADESVDVFTLRVQVYSLCLYFPVCVLIA